MFKQFLAQELWKLVLTSCQETATVSFTHRIQHGATTTWWPNSADSLSKSTDTMMPPRRASTSKAWSRISRPLQSTLSSFCTDVPTIHQEWIWTWINGEFCPKYSKYVESTLLSFIFYDWTLISVQIGKEIVSILWHRLPGLLLGRLGQRCWSHTSVCWGEAWAVRSPEFCQEPRTLQ